MKCECCGSVTDRRSKWCRNCAKYHKKRHGVMVTKNSVLNTENNNLKKRLAMYE